MSKYSPEMKAKRRELLPERMAHAKKRIAMAGYAFTCPDDMSISFMYKCCPVRFYPYTGWFTGKSVKDGRGLQNLLDQVGKKPQ